ncbi:MAG: sugar kinase [Clostridia bacterium]|nr:sugar kinase [Clostridia bacterium]
MICTPIPSRARLQSILEGIRGVKAVLIGDLCLDVYWSADMTRSVLSRETPHFPLPVTEERMSPGAGGNAAMNMAALMPASLCVVGMLGRDWRGRCLSELFEAAGLGTDAMLCVPQRFTNAYCKPMRRGHLGFEVEDPRIDFENFTTPDAQSEQLLIEKLRAAAADAQLLCVSDQFENGCITDGVRAVINQLAADGLLTVVDSRYRIGSYRNCLLKPNEIECARALGLGDHALTDADEQTLAAAAASLAEKTGSDIALTLGERGSLVLRNDSLTRVSAVKVEGPVDTVGAGDCFLSAFSLALASGAGDGEAACLGALATSVSVKKLGTTGTATPQEILAMFEAVRCAEGK